jgi:hypothetical protein
LAVGMVLLASRTITVPGLYYDEAIFGGMAKDFLTGRSHGRHLPGHEVISMWGHPFPLYVQAYLGAVKCWSIIPSFSALGPSLPVLRWTSLGWSLVALLLFMLWTRRLLGVGAAVVAGALLASDPTFFFVSLFDWGAVVPSFLCRFASLGLAVFWWQRQRPKYLFAAAVFAGLGLFNKIDFVVFLGGAGLAGICCYARPLMARLRAGPATLGLAAVGFVLAASPMLIKVPQIMDYAVSGSGATAPGEMREKVNTLLAMYDGSYFHRLMEVGGLFEKMYRAPSAVWTPTGLVLGVAAVFLAIRAARPFPSGSSRRLAVFLLLAAGLVTLGMLLLPEAVRLHHAVLVYPFPQLVMVAALRLVWQSSAQASSVLRHGRWLLPVGVVILVLWQLLAIDKTQRLIRETRGRGRWSDSLDAFCRQVAGRSNLNIVSLDWGFNEQLLLLTDGPELAEPFWTFGEGLPANLPRPANSIILVHPPDYSVFPYGSEFLNSARRAGTNVDIHTYCDREGCVVFYSIRFVAP